MIFHSFAADLHISEDRRFVIDIFQYVAFDAEEARRDMGRHDQAITFHQLAGVCVSRQRHRPVRRVLFLGINATDHIFPPVQKLNDLVRWPSEIIIQKEKIGGRRRIKKLRDHLAAGLGNERIAAPLRPASGESGLLAGRVGGQG